MKEKLYDEDGCRIPQTLTPSLLIRIFGYSVHGADYKKTSVDIDDPLFVSSNNNYCKGDIYSINTTDYYSSTLMKEDANRIALPWQNPDIYYKAAIGCASISLLLFVSLGGRGRGRGRGFSYSFMFGIIVLSVVAFLLSIVFVILYSVAMFFYRIQMRETAQDICYYYMVQKRKKDQEKDAGNIEEDSDQLLLSQNKYYSACPNCGAVRFGNYECCKMCGTSLFLPVRETT